MSGLELRKRLNENEFLRNKSIPFLFFSTAADPQQVQTAYKLTVQGCFKKPTTYLSLKRQLGLIIVYWNDCIHPDGEFYQIAVCFSVNLVFKHKIMLCYNLIR
jgi:hypothetical protein